MSIRLRLTLLYSTILTVTLLAFGGLLYLRQYQDTIEIERRFLTEMAERVADGHRKAQEFDPFGEQPGPEPPPETGTPWKRDDFGGAYFIRRSADGQEILELRTPDDVLLPLSDDALRAALDGETWMGTASVEGQRVLVYTVPIEVEGEVIEILQMGRSLTTRDQSISALGTNLLIACVAAIAIAFGLGWVLAGISLRPIHRLTETARIIGAERDFSRRVEHAGPDDEVGRLARTLNDMLAELQGAYEQVGQTLELQRQFVADVSHELRTPLTTLNGNVDLLRREPPISADDRTEVLADMASESQRLIRLVNDLLTLARADAHRSLQKEAVAVKPLVEEVCRQARLLAPEREVECCALDGVAAWGQADALKQVLLILLDNAIKHSDGAIAVSGELVEGSVAVRVRDDGPGIDPDLLPDLFERFVTGGDTDAGIGAGEGSGLGLAIAEALVEAQDGTIHVESQMGEGSVFTLTLPAAEG
jgi:signal transduction histidine kinase